MDLYKDPLPAVEDRYNDLLPAVEHLLTCWYISEAFSELQGKIQAAARTAFPSPLSPQG